MERVGAMAEVLNPVCILPMLMDYDYLYFIHDVLNELH